MSTRSTIGVAALATASFLHVASPAHAQWTATDLTPTGSTTAFALGNSATSQVGQSGSFASLWSGTSASWVSLNPTESSITATGSRCNAVFGTQQAGFATFTQAHAGIWNGTAASWVSLHPTQVPNLVSSLAFGTCGTQQVGQVGANGSRACLWNGTPESYVDLQPVSTFYGVTSSSAARSTNGTMQVGYITVSPNQLQHASLWSGTPESWVDLTPAGSTHSQAYAISSDGTQQVGWARIGNENAGMWSGNAASWVSLHPAGATSSQALSTNGAEQVGYAVVGGVEHASVWHGSAGTWVDLHPFLIGLGFPRSKAWSIWTVGATTTIVGECYDQGPPPNNARLGTKAFLLTRVLCVADFDDGSGTGTPDGGVTIDDLIYYLSLFEAGDVAADVDDGSNTGTPDGGVTIDDLIYYLTRFEAGC